MKLPPLLILAAAAACARVEPLRDRWGGRAGDRDVEIVIVHAPPDAAVAAQVRAALPEAVSLAGRWGALPSPLTLTVHPTHGALEVASRRPGQAWLRAWARPGAVELQSPRTWSRGAATRAELTELLAHELTHCAMFEAAGSDERVLRSIPAWFREGMATWTSGERFEGRVGARGAPSAGGAGSLSAYAAADHAFRALVGRHGPETVRALLAAMRAGLEFDAAFHAATGVAVEGFEAGLGPALDPGAAGRG